MSQTVTAAAQAATATGPANDPVDAAVAQGSELVLWFGDDLFCQLIRLRLLSRLDRDGALARVRLAGPGADDPDPGTCRLEAMDAGAIARAFAVRRPVDAETRDLALRAWRGFTSEDWPALEALARNGTPRLPALGPALARLLRERPDPETGLTATEAAALGTLDSGPQDGMSLFLGAARLERRRWYTDLMFLWMLRRLALWREPPILLEGEADSLEGIVVRRTVAGDALRRRIARP